MFHNGILKNIITGVATLLPLKSAVLIDKTTCFGNLLVCYLIVYQIFVQNLDVSIFNKGNWTWDI